MEAVNQPRINFPPALPKAPISSPPVDPTRALIELICSSRLPFSLVANPSFKHFVSAVQKHPNWKFPHRTSLASEELDKLYLEVITELKLVFKNCKYVALTVDLCSGADGVSYYAITASALDDLFVLRESVLACVPAHCNHSGEKLAEIAISVLTEIGLDEKNVVAVVADEGGGAHCVARYFPNAIEVLCCAHRLQTALRHAFDGAYEQYPLLLSVITTAKHISSLYNQSNIARAEIQVLQSMLSQSAAGLVSDVITRWLSQYNVLSAVKANEDALKVWIKTRASSDPVLSTYNPLVFWPLLNCLVSILEPFATVTTSFSTEKKPTLHMAVDNILWLKSRLASLQLEFDQLMLSTDAKASLSFLLQSLLTSLDEKFGKWSDLELAAYALYPDNRSPSPYSLEAEMLHKGYESVLRLLSSPFFKSGLSNSEAQPLPSGRSILPTSLSPLDSRSSGKLKNRILPSVSANELEEYKVTPMSDIEESMEQFWTRHLRRLPTLSLLAKLLYSVPCSQTASERLFSLLRLTSTHLRGRLHPETVNKLVTCSTFINRRNAALEESVAVPRTPEQAAADQARLVTLLSNNKKRKRETAEMIETAGDLLSSDVASVLESLRLPAFISILDPSSNPQPHSTGFLGDDDDGTLPDDEDFIPHKRPKLRESDNEDIIGTERSSPGLCTLTSPSSSGSLMFGSWVCSNGVKPTAAQIFQGNLHYVEFLPGTSVEKLPSIDAGGFLLPNFTFKLNKKGNKKFPTGRRSFIRAVGEEIQFC